jgi:hypothetical protein
MKLPTISWSQIISLQLVKFHKHSNIHQVGDKYKGKLYEIGTK